MYHLTRLAVLPLLFSVTAVADVPSTQRAEVDYLLHYVEASGCTLIRNGDRHAAAEARAHIEKKYDYFRDRIQSTEEFIELTASKSTLSGEFYTVDCPGRVVQRTRDWLLNALADYRSRRP